MKGFHKVATFLTTDGPGILYLPDGWKPFAAYLREDGVIVVVCRQWVRTEE